MPFQASSLAMVQSTSTWSTSPACTHGRASPWACAARIFCVSVIGREEAMEGFVHGGKRGPAQPGRDPGVASEIGAIPDGSAAGQSARAMDTWFELLNTLYALFIAVEGRTS